MSWVLNSMFNTTTKLQRIYWRVYMGSHNSLAGAQKMLFKDL